MSIVDSCLRILVTCSWKEGYSVRLLPATSDLAPDSDPRFPLYDAETPEVALRLASLGAAYVEAKAIGELLGDPRLNPEGRPRA